MCKPLVNSCISMTPSVFVSVKQWDVKIIVTAGKGSNMTKMQDLDDFFWRTVGSLTVQDKHGTQGLPSQTKQKSNVNFWTGSIFINSTIILSYMYTLFGKISYSGYK